MKKPKLEHETNPIFIDRWETQEERANRLNNQGVARINEMTDADMLLLEKVTKQVIAEIEGQNWTDEKLTDQEENIMHMAVASAYWYLIVHPRGKK